LGKEKSFFIDFSHKTAGLRIPSLCFLVIDFKTFSDVLFSVDAVETLVSSVENTGFSSAGWHFYLSDHFLYADNLFDFLLGPLAPENVRNELELPF
jgi:hypothetical protein